MPISLDSWYSAEQEYLVPLRNATHDLNELFIELFRALGDGILREFVLGKIDIGLESHHGLDIQSLLKARQAMSLRLL